MKERVLMLSIYGLLGFTAVAEPLPEVPAPSETATEIQAPAAEVETPPELTAIISEHDAAARKIEQQDAEARTALREWYASSIETLRQDAIGQGDLDRVVTIDAERRRIDTDISPEDKAKLFYTLRELRGRYDRQRSEQMRHASAEVRVGLQRYAIALDRVAGTLLKNGNAPAARVVENARLSMLGARPTSACAAGLPSVSTLTSTVLALRSTALANARNQEDSPATAGTATVPPATTGNVGGSSWGKSAANANSPGTSTGWATAAADPSKKVVVPSDMKPKAPPQTMGKGAQGVAKVVTPRSSGSSAGTGRTWGSSAPAGGGGTVGGAAWGAGGGGFR